MKTIAERIVYIAEDKYNGNMSELARKLDITPAYISKLNKNADAQPSDMLIERICTRLDVRKEWLISGVGDIYVQRSNAQKVADMMNAAVHADGSEAWQKSRRIIIESLAEMPPEFWEQAGAFLREIIKRENME